MVLIYNEQQFDIIHLYSYNSKSFIADIVCDETTLFPSEFEEEDYLILYSKTDKMKLKTIYPNTYDNFTFEPLEENLYKISFTQSEEIKPVVNEVNQLEELSKELQEKLKMGIMMPTQYGIQRFSFEEHDQQNLTSAYIYLTTHPEVEEYWYHANGEEMQLFPKETLLELHRIMIEFVNEQLVEYHKKKAELEA